MSWMRNPPARAMAPRQGILQGLRWDEDDDDDEEEEEQLGQVEDPLGGGGTSAGDMEAATTGGVAGISSAAEDMALDYSRSYEL